MSLRLAFSAPEPDEAWSDLTGVTAPAWAGWYLEFAILLRSRGINIDEDAILQTIIDNSRVDDP